MYPTLPKSYKGVYPFRLAAPSYIYPDRICLNAKMLAPYLDEIEIILFESAPEESLPSKQEIEKLSRIAKDSNLTYNIHLPIDIYLKNQDPSMRNHWVETNKRIITLTLPLSPSTYTLHLPFDETSPTKKNVERWQKLAFRSMEQLLLSTGIEAGCISIETLMYPFEWVEKIIAEFNLSVCIDIGHLVLQHVDIKSVFAKYSGKTSIIHLHGVKNGRDHVSLDKLPNQYLDTVMENLKNFSGVVSLEVFSYEKLKTSLLFLEKCWQKKLHGNSSSE